MDLIASSLETMSEGPFSQQEEQDSIGFVFAVLNSLSQEPAASDLERIAELTKSSCVDNSSQWTQS